MEPNPVVTGRAYGPRRRGDAVVRPGDGAGDGAGDGSAPLGREPPLHTLDHLTTHCCLAESYWEISDPSMT
jgi:hypothetical protein